MSSVSVLILEEKNHLKNLCEKHFENIKYNEQQNFYDLIVSDGTLPDEKQKDLSCNCLIASDLSRWSGTNIKAEQVIICGMNEWNSVGYSSIEDRQAHIFVKRIIKTLNGKTILPFERKILLKDNLSLEINLLFAVIGIYLNKV